MGHQRDHAIIVSSHDFPEAKEQIERARECALTLFGEQRVCEMIGPKHITNGRMSFFIAPDGSKEGWDESDENDALRFQFCDWMQEYTPYVKFVEVEFADEANFTPAIGRNSEENVPDVSGDLERSEVEMITSVVQGMVFGLSLWAVWEFYPK